MLARERVAATVAAMAATKRSTIYLDTKVLRVLRREAESTDRTLSDVVNETLRSALDEDASDQAVAASRAHERAVPLAQVVRKLKRSGKL